MKHRMTVLLFVVLLCVLPFAAAAQDATTLTYGGNASGTLSAQSPVNIYSFAGSAGDEVTIQVLGLETGMVPTLSMLTPSQQFLSASLLNTVESGGGSLLVTHTLPEDGVYTLIVGGTFGQYALLLDSEAPAHSLTVPSAIDVNFTTDGGQENYPITNDSSDPVAVFITSSSEVGPVVIIIDAANRGTLVQFTGTISETCFAIPGGSGNLDVTLGSPGGLTTIDVTLTVADGLCSGTPESTPESTLSDEPIPTLTLPPAPVATEEVSSPTQTPGSTSACTASSSGPVNVRSGPGTGYGVVTTLQPNIQVPVVGQSTNGWIVIQISGIQGYVSPTVVIRSGVCDSLPFLFPPEPGGASPAVSTATASTTPATVATVAQTAAATATQPPTPTALADQVAPTATEGQTQLLPPTATMTTTMAPTQPPTPTFTPSYTPTTPPPPPTAPPDGNYSITIPLDTTISVTDFVSFPNGDTEDRVSYSVSGMNPNTALSGGRARLILAVSCFGTGTQNLTFFTGGQSFSCGQTLVDREVTADSDTGSVQIRAVAGENTYVQWVVTGTATRVN